MPVLVVHFAHVESDPGFAGLRQEIAAYGHVGRADVVFEQRAFMHNVVVACLADQVAVVVDAQFAVFAACVDMRHMLPAGRALQADRVIFFTGTAA